jgi:NADP-dependent 3-hydroxy acid dehydrogenase YdfG
MIHMTTSLAVVTGAASGIGLALSYELVARSVEIRELGVAQWALDARSHDIIGGNPTLGFSEMS